MSNIQFKRGVKANLPTLSVGEPAFTTDTKEFFIGDGTTNIKINAAQNNSSVTTYTTTITTTWTGTTAPYTQSISIPGISASDTPIVDAVLSSTLATAQAEESAWNCVSKIVTDANKIVVTCNKKKPTTAIPIQLKVVR